MMGDWITELNVSQQNPLRVSIQSPHTVKIRPRRRNPAFRRLNFRSFRRSTRPAQHERWRSAGQSPLGQWCEIVVHAIVLTARVIRHHNDPINHVRLKLASAITDGGREPIRRFRVHPRDRHHHSLGSDRCRLKFTIAPSRTTEAT